MKRLLPLWPLLGLFANSAGLALYGVPKGPDILLGFSALGAFLVFLSYLNAQFAWGRLIAGTLGRPAEPVESFFFGSAFFTLLLGGAGFLAVVGGRAFALWNLLLLLGPALLAWRYWRKPDPAAGWPLLSPSLAAVALAVLALGLWNASFPHQFWDSLWYHLTGPRLWFEAGRVHLPEIFPTALKTGLWDYHSLLGQVLLGGEEGGGLVAAQLFAQWTHYSSLLFCFLLLLRLGERVSLGPAAALLAVVGTELFLVSGFAKNDGGAAFWSLACLWFFTRGSRPWLVGLAAGLAFTAKYTSAFFLLPLLLLLAWRERRAPATLGLAALAFLLGAAPVLGRNLALTGNPFFPALGGIFPTDLLGPSWAGISAYEGVTFGFAALKEKLAWLGSASPVVCGLFALPWAFSRLGRGGKEAVVVALTGGLLFLLFSGPRAEWRMSGAVLLLLGAYGARSVEIALGRLPSFGRALGALALAFALWLSPLPWGSLVPWTDPSLAFRSGDLGRAFAWTRLELPADARIATLNEQRIYPLFPHAPLRAFDIPALDRALHEADSPAAALAALRAYGIQYLVLSAEFLDLYYDARVVQWMHEIAQRNPGAVPFRAERAMVLDLTRLREAEVH